MAKTARYEADRKRQATVYGQRRVEHVSALVKAKEEEVATLEANLQLAKADLRQHLSWRDKAIEERQTGAAERQYLGFNGKSDLQSLRQDDGYQASWGGGEETLGTDPDAAGHSSLGHTPLPQVSSSLSCHARRAALVHLDSKVVACTLQDHTCPERVYAEAADSASQFVTPFPYAGCMPDFSSATQPHKTC